MKKIVAIHLLNDYSGSPLVLKQVLNELASKGHPIDIYTSATNKPGFLDEVKQANRFSFAYQWHANKWVTLFRLFISQLVLFRLLLKYRNQDVVIYVNTILPFGAAIAGKLMGKKVIYHIHETSIKPKVFKVFLKKIAAYCANEAIYVSAYLAQHESLSGVISHTIYNALGNDFIAKKNASITAAHSHSPFTVLMLCSLKKYKGVYNFIELAKQIPDAHFQLVLNAGKAEIEEAFSTITLPNNLTYNSATNNVHPYYANSNLVVNLSHPDGWVETFGMTILEAMNYGVPAIVPNVGGITELVEDGVNGYRISVYHKNALVYFINQLKKETAHYQQLCKGALQKALQFSIAKQANQIASIMS